MTIDRQDRIRPPKEVDAVAKWVKDGITCIAVPAGPDGGIVIYPPGWALETAGGGRDPSNDETEEELDEAGAQTLVWEVNFVLRKQKGGGPRYWVQLPAAARALRLTPTKRTRCGSREDLGVLYVPDDQKVEVWRVDDWIAKGLPLVGLGAAPRSHSDST